MGGQGQTVSQGLPRFSRRWPPASPLAACPTLPPTLPSSRIPRGLTAGGRPPCQRGAPAGAPARPGQRGAPAGASAPPCRLSPMPMPIPMPWCGCLQDGNGGKEGEEGCQLQLPAGCDHLRADGQPAAAVVERSGCRPRPTMRTHPKAEGSASAASRSGRTKERMACCVNGALNLSFRRECVVAGYCDVLK